MKKSPPKKSRFLVVGVGASAGGLAAIKSLFTKIKNLDGVSFIFVQHLDDTGKKLAVEALSKICKKKVIPVVDKIKIEPNSYYVIPPHTTISIEKGLVRTEAAKSLDQKLSVIDHTLSALGKEYGSCSMGVILSGEGNDGSQGIKTLNENDGLTIAQNPKTAIHRSMPDAAIATTAVDHILNPADIGTEIIKYAKYLKDLGHKPNQEALRDQISAAITSICEILQKQTQHDFKHYKTSTLLRRIQRRMQVLQLSQVEDYIHLLSTDRSEVETLFNELLINVTSFFRDKDAFEALKNEVLRELFLKRKDKEKIRIWVPGCSTGPEAYTIGILVHELAEELKVKPEVQLIATDIDEVALNVARKGSYPITIAENIPAKLLAKYFTKRGGRYHVNKELRDICLFSIHNLINDPPFSQLDLISCRNLLIYLGPHLQKKLFPVFHYALKKNGYLFLGTSESLTSHKELFKSVNSKHRIAQRKASAIKTAEGGISTSMHNYLNHFQATSKTPEVDIGLIAQRIALDEMPLKYAVMNDEGQILSMSAGINKYVEFPEGPFQNNLIKLVKPSLRAALRTLFNEAKKEKRKASTETCTIKTDSHTERVGLIVQPMPQLGEETGLFWVAFQYLGFVSSEKESKGTRPLTESDSDLIEQLETELSLVRNELDKSVQDLEASNEELKSSNEELLSMNEELQSANEELETSKEEIQIVNDALIRSNADLENLLAGTHIATLFLDQKMRIRGFTPAIQNIYRIQNTDLGREISDFNSLAVEMPPYPQPSDLTRNEGVEDEVQMPDGTVFLRRIAPYFVQGQARDGLVVSFINITTLRVAEKKYRNLADSMPQLIWSAEPNGLMDYANSRWFEFTGLPYNQISVHDWEKVLHPEDLPVVTKAWEQSLKKGTEFQSEYRIKNSSTNQYHWFLGRSVPVRNRQGQIEKWYGSAVEISNIKDLQNELLVKSKKVQEARDELKEFIMQAPEPLARLSGPEHRFSLANEAYIRYAGRDPIGKTVREAFTHEEAGIFFDILDTVYKTGQPYHGKELPFRRARGDGQFEELKVEVGYYPIRNSQGEITGISAFVHDVTAQVEARQIIETAKEFIEHERENFRNLFKQTPEMVCILSGPEHLFEFVNEAHIRTLGFDATGKTVREAQPESVEVHGILDNVYKTGVTAELHEIPVTVGSKLRHFNLTYAARRDMKGRVDGIMILGTEVTDQVELREKISESQKRYQMIFDYSPIPKWIVDRNTFKLLDVNAAAIKHYGFTKDEFLKLHLFDIRTGDSLENIKNGIADDFSHAGDFSRRVRHKRSDGSVIDVEVSSIELILDGRRVRLAAIVDMTRQNIFEDELKKAKETAEAANEAKTRFLANMSHEIRTPLAAIIGFSDLIQEQVAVQNEAHNYLDRISRNAVHLGRLIDELLDLSKIEADKLEIHESAVEIDSVIEDVLATVKLKAEHKGLDLNFKWITEKPEVIITDQLRLSQILTNVLGNAVKFTERGRIDVEFKAENKKLVIRVQDTGIGLSEEQQKRIFQPFMQADQSVTRKFGGTGLGLVLSRRLTQLLGGDLVLLHSKPDEGSLFEISISFKEEQNRKTIEVLGQENEALKVQGLKGRKLLIVDDAIDNRVLVTLYLKNLGIEIIEAVNGADAIEKIRVHDFDLILMDIQMPVMDGHQAMQKIKDLGIKTPVIALTAHALKEEKVKCFEQGFTNYLTKPISKSALIKAIYTTVQER